jgi:hypothetical protein
MEAYSAVGAAVKALGCTLDSTCWYEPFSMCTAHVTCGPGDEPRVYLGTDSQSLTKAAQRALDHAEQCEPHPTQWFCAHARGPRVEPAVPAIEWWVVILVGLVLAALLGNIVQFVS